MEIPIVIPIAIPMGMPITKSLNPYTYHKQRKAKYLKIIMKKLYKIKFLCRFYVKNLKELLSSFNHYSPVKIGFFRNFLHS